MGVKLNAALGGSVELVPTNTASNYTATMPAKTGTVGMDGPAFSATMSANQTISNAVSTKMQFNTEDYDTNSNYDTSTYRFTPTVAGYYLVNVSLVNTGTSTIGTYAQIAKNGAVYRSSYSASANAQGECSFIVYLNGSTDYVEGYAYLAVASGSPTVSNNTSYTYFQACLIRGA